MDKIEIIGGQRLNGEIPISGAKNAALPLMIASLLTADTLTLKNVPDLRDVNQLTKILGNHGSDFAVDGKRSNGKQFIGDTCHLTARDIVDTTAPYELVSTMRASFWVLGPLLARCHQAKVSLPGGCAIGTRPVDLHLAGLEALGANIKLEDGYVLAEAKGGLKGGSVNFPKVSVGATINVLMAATLAKGETVIENAALEPEVADVARCLVKMGAEISGIGEKTIHIQGQDQLDGAVHTVLPDRIETGTFLMAVAATGGDVMLSCAAPETLQSAIEVLRGSGVEITETDNGLRVRRENQSIAPVHVETQPHPGFPTDLQAQLMALMTIADGRSVIRETIFENRFMHVQELVRLGADISPMGQVAVVRGAKGGLSGAPVMATDLRASACLILAGLVARGTTQVNRIYHLDRGYEYLERKLASVGADIERIQL